MSKMTSVIDVATSIYKYLESQLQLRLYVIELARRIIESYITKSL